MNDALHPQAPQFQPPPLKPMENDPIDLDPIPLDDGDDLEPISLVEPSDGETSAVSKIRAFGVAPAQAERTWKRATHVHGTGAVRVRTFHGKLSEQGMDFMDNQINEWLDANPDIEIKFVTSAIGQFEGKIREPALVLNIWY